MESVTRFLDHLEGSFFLFGPRGTGKSTWVRQRFPGAKVIDLLADDTLLRYEGQPGRFAGEIRAEPADRVIVVDEVQKAPGLLDQVHLLMEEDRRRRFVLTGSSARKLKRGGADLLAGRAAIERLHPFMAAELGEAFDFGTALERGLLPVVWASPSPERALRAYVGTYVREEVRMEGLVRSTGTFSRFLEAVSFSHAGVLNCANVARECEAKQKTVQGYVEILEDLLLGYRLPVFEKRAGRAMTAHAKFYFSDAGIFRALRPSGPLDRREEIEGAALEGLVAQHLRAWIDYRGRKNELYFWRTQGGSEADLVLYGDDGIWAVEVKNSDRVRPEDSRGLRTFLKDYPEARALLLHRGTERSLRDRILCLPVPDFLNRLRPDRTVADAAQWP